MDIPKMSMSLANSKLASSVNMSMMKKAMDQTKIEGQQISEMIATTNVVSATKVNTLA